MKKLTTILSPLVLMATTTLAQDSTCILQPSCSQLGYTSAEADCGSQKVLRCPFDVSQVACVGSGTGDGGGAGGDNYNPNDPNNELGDVIALKINMTAAGNTTFTYGGGNIYVDCGNGTIVGGSAGSSSTVSCTYSAAGTYTVKLSGDFTYYGGSSPTATTLLKLDKSGITKMSNVCDSGTNGVVPPLPSTLKDATEMFKNCSSINSPYPKLPDGLEIANYMFGHSSSTSMNFSGDVKLPSSLKYAKAMFRYNKKLNTVTGLENTQLIDGSSMFNASGVISVSGLPETLTNGSHMFTSCTNLPTLPNLPDSLTNGYNMFRSCSNMSGTLTSLPSALTIGAFMFDGASKITGSPAKPAGLTSVCLTEETGCYSYIFYGTGVEVNWL